MFSKLDSLSLEELHSRRVKVEKTLSDLQQHQVNVETSLVEFKQRLSSINEIISKRESELEINIIRDEVEKHGFACRINYSLTPIAGLKMLKLPFFINREPIGTMASKQREWVHRLGFKYCQHPLQKYDRILSRDYIRNHQDCDDKIVVLKVGVYYRSQLCPKEGTHWEAIDTEGVSGEVKDWSIKDGILICDDDIVGTIEDWDGINEDYGHLILPNNAPEIIENTTTSE
jgi:hypothetical protein